MEAQAIAIAPPICCDAILSNMEDAASHIGLELTLRSSSIAVSKATCSLGGPDTGSHGGVVQQHS